jgi:hypothetical protein
MYDLSNCTGKPSYETRDLHSAFSDGYWSNGFKAFCIGVINLESFYISYEFEIFFVCHNFLINIAFIWKTLYEIY